MNIKDLRIKNKLTQQELADMTGIPKGRINGWEQNGSKPKYEDMIILREFFENKVSQASEPSSAYQITPSIMHVPMVSQYAYSGYLSGFADNEYMETLPTVPFMVDKEAKGL